MIYEYCNRDLLEKPEKYNFAIFQGEKFLESYIDSRPGKKPYEMLKRDVQVVLYRLHRGTEELFCRMEYDSQQESVQENCSVNEKILQTKILD